jgi:hypothetical protein
MVQLLTYPVSLPQPSPTSAHLSIVTYNVLLPNSADGWWNYKMYSPPLDQEQMHVSTWEYRKQLLKDKLALLGKYFFIRYCNGMGIVTIRVPQ